MQIEIQKPNCFHAHLRWDYRTPVVLEHMLKDFRRILVMPNTKPPIRDVGVLEDYKDFVFQTRKRLLREDRIIKSGLRTEFLWTLKMHTEMTVESVKKAKETGVSAFKWYPVGVTTNSEDGLSMEEVNKLQPVFRAMEQKGILLLIHGERPGDNIYWEDRERKFIPELEKLLDLYPDLKIVFEHITCKEAVEYVLNGPDNLAATITPHHLLLTANDVLEPGIRPHNFCKPTAKRRRDLKALRKAATSGNSKFFAGTDTAPHVRHQKESCCGCAGIYNAPTAVVTYIEVFEEMGALDNLEDFLCLNGEKFYGLKQKDQKVTFVNEPFRVPDFYTTPHTHKNSHIVPFRAGEELKWRLLRDDKE